MRDFVQAGAQRFQYELIRAIDKERYHVDVLVPIPLDRAEGMFPREFYYPLMQQSVNQIHTMGDVGGTWHRCLHLIGRAKTYISKRNPFQHLLDFMAVRVAAKHQKRLSCFLNGYDAVGVTEYDFCFVKDAISDLDKVMSYVMTARSQTLPRSQFEDYDRERVYTFVAGWDEVVQKNELSYFTKGHRLINVPLILDVSDYQHIEFHPSNEGVLRLGLFTRISPLKPVEPFLFALHLMVSKGLNVHLHHFGAVADRGISAIMKDMLLKTIHILGLEDRITFEGHAENIVEACADKGIGLVWQQGFMRHVGGYAGIELMLAGVPHAFFDFETLDRSWPQGELPEPYFHDVVAFADFSERVLTNSTFATQLGQMQREHIMADRDVYRHLPTLYAEFDRLAAKPR
jgi:glycosyltransferase involved in cell wall biosynthesis